MSYIGTQPNNVKKNIGIYNPNEILRLTKDGNWGGSMEFIAEQNHSSDVADIDFTSIKQNKYDVHLLLIKNLSAGAASQSTGIQLYESGVLETASVYQYANLYNNLGGGGSEIKSTGYKHIRLFNTSSQAINSINSYIYFYNLGDSSKYSFTTMQFFMEAASGTFYSYFGGGLLPQTSEVDGIRIDSGGTNNYTAFETKLYGIKKI
jgi:hypothetical protein